MKKPIAVLFADSHLAEKAWAGRDIRGDSYFSLRQIVNYAVDTRIPAVIGAGDLIDKQSNRSGPINVWHQELDRLERAGIRFLHIQGQHELEPSPWLSGHRHAEHLHNLEVEIGGVRLFGIDFHPADTLGIMLGSVPLGTNVLVAHQVWAEFGVNNPQASFADVPSVEILFTGDYHVNQAIETRNKDGRPMLAVSPGSTCAQSIDESPAKFFAVLFDDLSIEWVQLWTRPFHLVEVNTAEQAERLVVELPPAVEALWDSVADPAFPEEVRKPLVRVVFSHEVAKSVVPVVNRLVGGRCHLFWKELPVERPETALRRRTAAEQGQRRATTLAGLLPEYLDQHDLRGLGPMTLRLLEAGDVAGELVKLKAEVLTESEATV